MQFKKVFIVIVASIFLTGCGSNLSADVVKSLSQTFINENLLAEGTTAEISEVAFESGLWRMKVQLSSGLEVDAMLSADGKYFIPEVFDVEEIQNASVNDSSESTEMAVEVPKNDRPVVELFVMSHCPFGTQAEKAILPAVEALGDAIDFKTKFVYYVMHGETEVREELRQFVIQENYPEKYLAYLAEFLEAGDSSTALEAVGLTEADLADASSAVDAKFNIFANLEDQSSWLSGSYPLFGVHAAENEKYGIAGSPGLVINNTVVNGVSRSPAGMLAAICAGFENPVEACLAELDTANSSSGFGYEGAGGDTGSCS